MVITLAGEKAFVRMCVRRIFRCEVIFNIQTCAFVCVYVCVYTYIGKTNVKVLKFESLVNIRELSHYKLFYACAYISW